MLSPEELEFSGVSRASCEESGGEVDADRLRLDFEQIRTWPHVSMSERCEWIRALLDAAVVGIFTGRRNLCFQSPERDARRAPVDYERISELEQLLSSDRSGNQESSWLEPTPGQFPYPCVFVDWGAPKEDDTPTLFWAAFEEAPDPAPDPTDLRTLALMLKCAIWKAAFVQEHRDLEAMIQQSQRLAGVGQLATGVAHDFNNLLTVIQGNLALLRPSIPSDAPDGALESLDTISATTDRAVQLTRQLLSFGRDQDSHFSQINLNGVITNFGRMMRRMIEENIELDFELAPALPRIQADSGMVCQILMNLLVNARDAMPRGGRISVRTEAIPSRGAESDDHGHVLLSIEDTGTGIERENLDRIFEPFFSTKQKAEGTGLGLANVASLVRQHNGEIHVESEIGRGTRFELRFPGIERKSSTADPAGSKRKTGPKSAKRAPVDSDKSNSLRGTRVLLVEDEKSVRRLVRKLLEMLGCEVIESHSGRDALDRWPEIGGDISMVVTDVMMPEGVSGWDLARTLHESNPDLGILLTSGYNEKPEQHGLGDIPEIAFLQKPYDAKTLREGMGSLLAQVS